MKVVIAEKPSVARELARVLKATEKKDGYLQGNGYQVTWAIGHLVSLASPEDYGWDKWKMEDLPMLPSPFKLCLPSDAGIKKQFKVIKELFSSASEILVATDAGREGELIFRYIYTLSGCRQPFKRLWISSQTDAAILEGFANLKPGSDYDNLYKAAKARSEADWLVGMNATRALTITAGKGSLLSIGRVQTPVLAMICERYVENTSFTPEPYYQIVVTLEKEGKKFIATHPHIFQKEEEAKAALLKVGPIAICIKAETKRVHEKAPLLFDLTSLQQETNKKFGFSAQQTLDLAQDLYEKYKLITYPRTGSRFLSDDIYKTIPGLMKVVGALPKYARFTTDLLSRPISKKPFDSSKVTDHHAILPTDTSPAHVNLPENHLMLYDLIATRFLAAFSDPCQKDATSLEFLDGILFRASGSVIIVAGWRGIETESKEEESEDSLEQKLPRVEPQDKLPASNGQCLKKMTRPKPLLNEASLLKLMETAGKEIEDESLRETLKDIGIGTPATRASTIEVLFKRDYIKRDKKKILPTPKGMEVYGLVAGKLIARAELTGSWEKGLNMVAAGSVSYENFMEKICEFTKSITTDLSGAKPISLSNELGLFENRPITAGIGKYGPYVKWNDTYYNMENKTVESITAAQAIAAIKAKREGAGKEIGSYEQKVITAGKGKYGTYVKWNEGFYNIANKEPSAITLLEAIAAIEAKASKESAGNTGSKPSSLIAKVGKYEIHNGTYGIFVTDGSVRASVKKGLTLEQVSAWKEADCKAVIASYKEWKKKQAK